MRRFRANGEHIKRLRRNLEKQATQKEFAHQVRISERQLRAIENCNAQITADVLDRMARALGMPRQALVFATDQPRLVQDQPDMQPEKRPESPGGPVQVPRFDETYARVVRDEAELLENAARSHVVRSHVLTGLDTGTESAAEEMLDILESVTWERRDPLVPLDGRATLSLRRRLRELLVLLKGNDVWTYADTHIKRLPESDCFQPRGGAREMQMQLIVAFGPPGEYGEDALKVPVDNGQPYEYDPAVLPF